MPRPKSKPSLAATPLLRALWRQRACQLASNVSNRGREHREIAHAAALIQQDYHDRFLIELIQNANDQAIRGHAPGSTVYVLRSRRLLAVCNGGQGVTAENLERLSSLADSDKSGALVGNKGVGFKSVYQITDLPEVYSATAHSVFEQLDVGIALERDPFRHAELVALVEDEIRKFLKKNAGLARALVERGAGDPLAPIRDELPRVAGFKFPLPRGAGDLAARTDELAIPLEYRPSIRTMVVLPLRDAAASAAVDRAIERLTSGSSRDSSQAELAVLFLEGAGRIVVRDGETGAVTTIERNFALAADGIREVEVTATSPSEKRPRVSRFWLARGSLFDCDAATARRRRSVVAAALNEFGLEAWSVDDPIHVTVALRDPDHERPSTLGSSGRFCVGLPTLEPTGLPAHVDARFFATISRTGLDLTHAYNKELLEVAVKLFDDLLAHLRASPDIRRRRMAVLALQRFEGGFAEAVYEPGGVADKDVVLAWSGDRFIARRACLLPDALERPLLRTIGGVLSTRSEQVACLPEPGLLEVATDALESMGLAGITPSPHPWLTREGGRPSVVEQAACVNRGGGPSWWEPFVEALLACFAAEALEGQRWLPIAQSDLAAPKERVFLPGRSGAPSDDEEVGHALTGIAAHLRIFDGAALPIWEEGRNALSELATSLVEEKLVRRSRKLELLEEVLFPALEDAAATSSELAMDLFGQAMAWIASMREASRRKLDCKRSRLPVEGSGGVGWEVGSRCYLGDGWGLPREQEELLRLAYPGQRLLPFHQLAERFRLTADDAPKWAAAAATLGVSDAPKVLVLAAGRPPPLESSNGSLRIKGKPSLDQPALAPIYDAYLELLTSYRTPWSWTFEHDVDELKWIDGLEDASRRIPILELMLLEHPHYLPHARVSLRRVKDAPIAVVPQLWSFAIERLGWQVLPAERGAGGTPLRLAADQIWRIPDGSRRAGYAKLLDVVPHRLLRASMLLELLGVASLEDASVGRLLGALAELASRLEEERLSTRQEALSLAMELFARLDAALAREPRSRLPRGARLPLLRKRALVAFEADLDTSWSILFNDEPTRSRHVLGFDDAYQVPMRRDAGCDRVFDLLARTWGAERVQRTSMAPVGIRFEPVDGPTVPFPRWLEATFPHTDVAVELAAMLTLATDKQLRLERVSGTWRAFESLTLEFGAFRDGETRSFYDRPAAKLMVAATLASEEVLGQTWQVAGIRSRDQWLGYARALAEGSTREFLQERGITQVELVDVADAAGLHRAPSVESVEAALLAAWCHLNPGVTLDRAAAWWSGIRHSKEAVAQSLDRPDLLSVLSEAMALRPPEGDLLVVRHLGVPWQTWQLAVSRRDGRPYVFAETVRRYVAVRAHVMAIAREVAVRSASVDLDRLAALLLEAAEQAVPDDVATLPPDVAAIDAAARAALEATTAPFPVVCEAIQSLPPCPWSEELPIPKDATKRGVRLFLDEPTARRRIEAFTSVAAVATVAGRLAESLGERVDPVAVLGDPHLVKLTDGEWAHVYAALLRLRSLLEGVAPETVKRLSAVQAFRDPCTEQALVARIPEAASKSGVKPAPKQTILGVTLTAEELRSDLAAGASGALGAKLSAAAAQDLDPRILLDKRRTLSTPKASGGGRGGGAGGGAGPAPRRESELTGDLGEAFVHEWLSRMLGADYGPECWLSKARQRYGLPPCGEDDHGFDFRVSDPAGRLFGVDADICLIEVKATTTDGSGPFPMSRCEWEQARRSHLGELAGIYVIVRVSHADKAPRICDVVVDPFGMYVRGSIRLTERDLWVSVAALDKTLS